MRAGVLFLAVFLLVSGPALRAAAANASLPPKLAATLEASFPGSRLVANSSLCRSSPRGAQQMGLVLARDGALRAVVAVDRGGWVLSDVPRAFSNASGGTRDFLSDFATNKNRPDIRCAQPHRDADISTRNNGQFQGQGGRSRTDTHVCFMASAAYNSWVCFWTPPKAHTPSISFVQFNAD
ncbi:hypothetical protein [Microvirga antarctica]|uniref:hypothetical protein n=1 Tax=Microvirga antarctica TaxID=2819233 RepID=UPI001B30660C|nr:hypothetical protein [Microvirga antarctica]